MKKSTTTFLSCLALLLFLSPAIFAQQTTTESSDNIIIIQKATGQDGVIEIDRQSLEKGEKLKTYLDQLNIEKINGEVKIEVHSDTESVMEIEKSGDEETIFFFRSAKSDHAKVEELEKLVITLEDDFAKGLTNKKPLLGVYSQDGDQGVLITGLVHNGGAKQAGIKEGDIITKLNDQAVFTSADLRNVIGQYQPGETLTVDLIRDGTAMQLQSTLGEKETRRSHHRRYYSYDNSNDYYYNSMQDRNPCDVFIGVYTSDTRNGLTVHNIIANTPADRSNVQDGDKIVAIDDVEVSNHKELTTQRDLHQPGDYFTLSIIRNGQPMEIDAQFEACPTTEEITKIKEETPEVPETVVPEIDLTQNTLSLESFNAFPNPTYGPVNVKFKGEAVPTIVRLTDVTGKVVYEESLQNFDGIYNNVINYKNAKPGTLILTIQQDQKVFSESLVLLPRA